MLKRLYPDPEAELLDNEVGTRLGIGLELGNHDPVMNRTVHCTRRPDVFSRAFLRNRLSHWLSCVSREPAPFAGQSGAINFNTFTVGARVYDSDGRHVIGTFYLASSMWESTSRLWRGR